MKFQSWPNRSHPKVDTSYFQDENVSNGEPPPDLSDVQLSFVPGVLFDNAPVGHTFGDCLLQPPNIVYQGEVVTVR